MTACASSPGPENQNDRVHHGTLSTAITAENEVDAIVQVEFEQRVTLEVLEIDTFDDTGSSVLVLLLES